MKKQKNIGSNILIVVLIFLAIASVCAGLFAWAKYQTTINGTATGETAKWSFKVTDGNTETANIDFPMSRTDNNTSVVEGKIAPGTYGEMKIEVDASGTETSLIYRIEAQMENAPKNLKFYSDSNRTIQLNVTDNKFTKNGYMMLNEIGKREEIIYWEWPYETGTTAEWIEKNDEIDTEDSSEQMSMQLIVTGEQINGNPTLADLVQVGDYVNYNASSNGPKTFTSADCLAGTSISDTISTDNVVNAAAPSQWRVLSVDRNTKNIELIAIDATEQTLTIEGNENGFINAELVLNNIGAIYGQGKGANGGRSLNLEDVEQYSSYDRRTFKDSQNRQYGTVYTLKSGKAVAEIKDDTGKVIGYDSMFKQSPIEITFTYYAYSGVQNYFSNLSIFEMIFHNSIDASMLKSVWLATRCLNCNEWGGTYRVHIFSSSNNGSISNVKICDTVDKERDNVSENVIPVVTLNTGIKTTGQNADGVWQLDI